jgi:hypothetical protein
MIEGSCVTPYSSEERIASVVRVDEDQAKKRKQQNLKMQATYRPEAPVCPRTCSWRCARSVGHRDSFTAEPFAVSVKLTVAQPVA